MHEFSASSFTCPHPPNTWFTQMQIERSQVSTLYLFPLHNYKHNVSFLSTYQ
jgi:hypothetical protein